MGTRLYMDFVCGAQQCLKSKAPGKNEMFPSFCIFLRFRVNFIATAAAAPFTVCFACFRNALVTLARLMLWNFQSLELLEERQKVSWSWWIVSQDSGPWANHFWHLPFWLLRQISWESQWNSYIKYDLFFTPKRVFERPHWVSTFLSNSRCVHTNRFERYCLPGWILVRNPI